FAVLAFLAAPLAASAQDPGEVLDTGVVQFEFYDNGELGAFADGSGASFGTGFVFNGLNGLYEGTLLVGQSFSQVSGEAYELSNIGPDSHEWVNVTPMSSITPPAGF